MALALQCVEFGERWGRNGAGGKGSARSFLLPLRRCALFDRAADRDLQMRRGGKQGRHANATT